MKIRKHPAATALESWLNSAEGKSATQPTTLNAPEMMRHYLENRLHRAFNAGWRAAEKHKSKTVAARPNEKS